MPGTSVFIDRSQFPENVRRDLIESLREKSINPKFHYDSYRQATKWLALHEVYSPARNNSDCARIYDEAFKSLLGMHALDPVHVIGLGCGGGQKEAHLLNVLQQANKKVAYTAADVSVPLVITAHSAAISILNEPKCRAVVCDVGTAEDLATTLGSFEPDAARIITLFGVIPNFTPSLLLSKLTALLRPDDLLLVSANLSPGPDYDAGVRAVQHQYDNALTRDWLLTFLLDVGFEHHDGEIRFGIEIDAHQFRRIVARFVLKQSREIRVSGERFRFANGESIRLFYSYRHTTETIQSLMAEQRIKVLRVWTNATAEEGIFLCQQSQDDGSVPA